MTAPAVLNGSVFGSFPTTASTAWQSGLGSSSLNNTTAAITTQDFQVDIAGTLNNLYSHLSVNARTTNSTLTIYKNGSAGAIVATALGSTTGIFSDTSNSISVAQNDNIGLEWGQGTGAGASTMSGASVNFTAGSGTSHFLSSFTGAGQGVATASTNFLPLSGFVAVAGTEANVQMPSAIAGTAHGLQMNVTANSRVTSSTLRLRKNAANGTQALTILAAATGVLVAASTDAIAALDKLSAALTTTSTGTLTFVGLGVWIDATTDTESNLVSSKNSGVGLATGTKFLSVYGVNSTSATETTVRSPAGVAGTVTLAGANVVANASTVDCSLTFRKNAANGNNVATILASTTGVFQDTTPHNDTIAATDFIDYQLSGHNGTVTIIGCFAKLVTTSSGNVYNVSIAETASAADTLDAQAIFPSAIAESGTAADTVSSSAVFPSAIAEAASATDSQASSAVMGGVVADTLGAADTVSSTAIYPSAIVEAGNAQDTDSAPPTGGSVVSETMNATDVYSATVIYGAAIVEAASATNTQGAAAIFLGGIIEAGSASDAYSSKIIAACGIAEAMAAVNVQSCVSQFGCAVVEAMAAADIYDGGAVVRYATKCNTLSGGPRVRRLEGGPRIRSLGGRACD